MTTLADKTLFITGATRGIGREIALRAARDGANVVIAAKTTEPHSKLPHTIHSTADAVRAAGGQALAVQTDIRFDEQVQHAVEQTVAEFGGIDIVINNASAIALTPVSSTSMKRYDLIQQINTRGTFLVSQTCLPHLKKSDNPHILTLSPPINLNPRWFKNHTAYTISKYGMSLAMVGMAAEFERFGIAVNALWPHTIIQTAALTVSTDTGKVKNARLPNIVSDAAYAIITRNAQDFTGNFCIDETVLREIGVTDFDQYAVEPGVDLAKDFFLD